MSMSIRLNAATSASAVVRCADFVILGYCVTYYQGEFAAVHPILVPCISKSSSSPRKILCFLKILLTPLPEIDKKKQKTLKNAIDSGLAGPQLRGRRA